MFFCFMESLFDCTDLAVRRRLNRYRIFTNLHYERNDVVNLERMNYNERILITEIRQICNVCLEKEYILE